MPVGTPTLLTNGIDTTPTGANLTASISPAANALILIAVLSHDSTGSEFRLLPNSITGCGLTWTQITYVTTGGGVGRLSLWRGSGASPSSGTISINFNFPPDTRVVWEIIQITNVDTATSQGVVQFAITSSTSTTPSLTLAALGNADNATLGFL